MNALIGRTDVALAFLLALTLKATLVLALAWILELAVRARSAALRHAVWAAAVLGSLLLPILTLVLPTWRSPHVLSAVERWSAPRPILAALAPSTLPAMNVEAIANASPFGNLRLVLLGAWLVGVSLLALKLALGIVRLKRSTAKCKALSGADWESCVSEVSRKLDLGRPVRLLIAEGSRPMPLTWGIQRPRIVLPADANDWSEERKRIVMAHELAHIRRHDWVWQMCAEALRILYWFHPLAWVAAAKLRHESERACDDCVLNSGVAGLDYAQQLLALARSLGNSRPGWATALAVARPSSLERRLVAMLNPSINRRGLTRAARSTIAAMAILLLLPLAALRLPAQNLSGAFTGSVYDASGTGVRNATVVMTIPKTYVYAGKEYSSNDPAQMTTTDDEGKFSFNSLPAGQYELKILKPGFEVYRDPQVVLDAGRASSVNATLKLGSLMEEVEVVPDGSVKPSPESENGSRPESVETPTGRARLRLGGEVEAAKLIKKVQPLYPGAAKAAGAHGTVVLHAVIGLDGTPLSIVVMNKDMDPALARASVEAVSQWRYQPTLLNGQPVEVDTIIKVTFTLRP